VTIERRVARRDLPNRLSHGLRLGYDLLLRAIVKITFRVWQAVGLHLTVNHFYQPIPDTRSLAESTWSKISELPGIEMNEAKQLALLAEFETRFKDEYAAFAQNKTSDPEEYFLNNKLYFGVDAAIYYCMIRKNRPRRITEIGSGYSTLLASRAILKNQEEDPRYVCELTAIEPDPSEFLRAGLPGLSRLIAKPVQEVSLAELTRLGENDILFIDSSHTLRIGSDVQLEYLEILPRLRSGVLVHVHDVFLPLEYPREWVIGHYRFWNEQYLLQAFLTFNHRVEVVWAGCYLHVRHPDRLRAAFAFYRGNEFWQGRRWLPSSFWLRILEPGHGLDVQAGDR
jgi:predicted O-methyltransferase YrrM